MRSLIIGLVVFLAACNGSTTEVQKAPYTDPALTAKLDALTQALADATHAQAQQAVSLGKLTLIGKVHGVSTESIRMQGEFRTEAVSTANFGPCTDMGVLIAHGGQDSPIPLASEIENFQTCTGYSYAVSVFDGTVQIPTFVAWDGPNCTGNVLIETDIPGDGYNPQITNGGVVFKGPLDGVIYMVKAGQIPVPTVIASSINTRGGTCGADVETRLTVSAISNDVNISGVQDSPLSLPISLTAP